MNDLTVSTPPEFRKVNGFTFRKFSGLKEESAYYETVDDALDEIEEHAFGILTDAKLPVCFSHRFYLKTGIVCYLVENLRQHEMPLGGELYYRSYLANEPVFGLRLEFWGAATYPLPPALTAREWFTAQNRPWQERVAPEEARQGGNTHTALSDLFDSLEYLELAGNVYFGWREDHRQEGPRPNGHIIAVHCAVFVS